MDSDRQQLHDAIARLSAHEQVCGYRYEALETRTSRIETILWSVAGGTILQLVALVMYIGAFAIK